MWEGVKLIFESVILGREKNNRFNFGFVEFEVFVEDIGYIDLVENYT